MNFFTLSVHNFRIYLRKLFKYSTDNCFRNTPELGYALDVNVHQISPKATRVDPLRALNDFINDGFLWAVPKHRRSLERRMTRRMGFGKVLVPKKNIVVCNTCGHFHPVHTVCGNCYEKVKQETELMKEAIEKELKLDPIDREVVVLYEDEAKDSQTFQGKRIVELPKECPKWFSRNLLAKDSEVPRSKPKAIGSVVTPPTIMDSDK